MKQKAKQKQADKEVGVDSTVKSLVEDGVRLVSMIMDVVEEEVVGVIEEEITRNKAQGQSKAPSKLQLNKFGMDVWLFLNELEAYVLAVEGDKMMMKVVNALKSFGDSVWNLGSTGVKQQRERDWGLAWTQWLYLGVIKMHPPGTIPILSRVVVWRSGCMPFSCRA